MKRVVGIATLLFTLAPFAVAGSSVGTRSAEFLSLGAGARAEAMGQAFTAVADDASALYWNPAGLARVRERNLLVMHAPYVESSFFDFGSFVQPVGKRVSLAAGVQYHSAGKITKLDASGAEVGSFSPSDTAFSLSGGVNLTAMSVGASVKWINSKLVDSASTIAFDAGFTTPRYFDKLSFGVAAQNLGGKLKHAREEEQLPTTYRAGVALAILKPWLISADFVAPSGQDAYVAMGSEWTLRFRDHFALSLRAGYLGRSDVMGMSTLTGGMGFQFHKLAFDYALAPMGDLGLTHRISTSIGF